MRLRISHRTTYRYTQPVHFRQHRLVLRPREGHDLRVEHLDLQLKPDHSLLWTRDVFGNSIALADFLGPSDQLVIVNDVTIERLTPFPARDLHNPWRVALPPSYDPMEAALAQSYQTPSFPGDQDLAAVKAWIDRELSVDPTDAEGTMLALGRRIAQTVAYQRRTERGVQTPARTLELGNGSCRDLATLMMEIARSLGVAARFASGYFHCEASLAGHASTHAWTEIYLPGLGWRGFDPTTGDAVSLRHIVTGVSAHPRGVMPVSGSFVGNRAHYQSLEVAVRTEELGAPFTTTAT